MPLYEYECLKCGTHFDEIQKFSDPPLTEHPGCGGEVRKVLSAPAIQFKGTGWYITDYARAGKSDGDKKSDKKIDKTDKKEAKSDTSSKSESMTTPSESTKASTTETSKT